MPKKKKRANPEASPRSYWWQVVAENGEIISTTAIHNVSKRILRIRAMAKVSAFEAYTINIIDFDDDPLWPKKPYDYFTLEDVKGAHRYIPQEYELVKMTPA